MKFLVGLFLVSLLAVAHSSTTAPPETTVTTQTTKLETTATETTKHETTVTTEPPQTTKLETTATETTKHETTVTTEPPQTTKLETTATSETTKHETTPHETTEQSTTQPPPVTTPNPADSTVNEFVWRNENNNVTCMDLKAKLYFNINYKTKDKKDKMVTIGVAKDHTLMGNCSSGNGTQTLRISFDEMENFQVTITFMNGKSSQGLLGDSNYISWSHIDFKYNLTNGFFPDVNVKDVNKVVMVSYPTNAGQFQANADGSYKCNVEQSLALNTNVTMAISELQYFAFGKTNSTTFNDITECSADTKTNSIVPIAVGAALAGLVVIVLIAYLIGRRRNRKGYESV